MPKNTKIYTHKTDAMRQLINLVSRGHNRYITGTVTTEFPKPETLTEKFARVYNTDRTHMQRVRAKARGETNTHLILWLESPEQLRWWLVTTAGAGVICELETLKDATAKKTRLELTGYELVQTPREGKLAQWTWRMTSDTYEAWQERLKAAIRHFSDDGLRQAIYSLKHVPAFSDARKQAFSLAKQAQGEWKRSKNTDWPYGDTYIGWFGRFKKAETLSVTELRSQLRRGKQKK
jgi:hypothetical protein